MLSKRDLQTDVAVQQKLDWIECQHDPIAFLTRHVRIEEPDGTVIPFRLWPFQRKTVKVLVDETLVVVLKARRLGLSWIVLALALWLAIFHQGIRVLILCKTEGDAAELLDRVRRMRDRIAEDPASRHLLGGLLKPAKVRDAVTTLDVGASTLRALVGTPKAARSETAGLVIWDEAAFQRWAEDIWQGMLPTIEGGGRLWVVSTGNGAHGDGALYAEMWQRAANGQNSFAHLFWPWDARPDRDEAWKRRQIDALGSEERFKVEYPETPDDAFIAANAINVYSREHIAAAVRAGSELDRLREQGDLPAPVGGLLHVGCDFGEFGHVLVLWPLERGGYYVLAEHTYEHVHEVDAEARPVVREIQGTGHPLGRMRFDASMPRDAKWFLAGLRKDLGGSVRPTPVAFNKHKRSGILYIRHLLANVSQPDASGGILAVSPCCRVLARQMETLEFKSEETEDVVKADDHGPDALVAGVAPDAKRWKAQLEEQTG